MEGENHAAETLPNTWEMQPFVQGPAREELDVMSQMAAPPEKRSAKENTDGLKYLGQDANISQHWGVARQ